MNKRSLPAGLNFDYENFKEFEATSTEDVKQQQKNLKAMLAALENDLKTRSEVSAEHHHTPQFLLAFLFLWHLMSAYLSLAFRWLNLRTSRYSKV